MLRSIEVLGLRAIRYARLELNGFQVLVGPNASGKSTLLDALTLVRDVLTVGIDRALRDRSWKRTSSPGKLAFRLEPGGSVREGDPGLTDA